MACTAPFRSSVDFRGGTQVQVQFQQTPDITAIRQAVDAAGINDATHPELRRGRQSTKCSSASPRQ